MYAFPLRRTFEQALVDVITTHFAALALPPAVRRGGMAEVTDQHVPPGGLIIVAATSREHGDNAVVGVLEGAPLAVSVEVYTLISYDNDEALIDALVGALEVKLGDTALPGWLTTAAATLDVRGVQAQRTDYPVSYQTIRQATITLAARVTLTGLQTSPLTTSTTTTTTTTSTTTTTP